eukprot:CAMPEP_0118700046 /NCGR_PEP_ID=MMETSP0800-20121206/16312_1 /TAXON_ID=210618 ORGANISM="Striatella unipunctata, Strain CCMP2910" /NCGR_SAMPLE_ID=MMETSP0800 /ASSEMBLY_ACC=CAM_ASM_000638 /LENGTH=105 /DNA_ID=CAMNT_0006600481 /DNA_START=316 /DNA_END=634 /DNA_ORIENTATION=+
MTICRFHPVCSVIMLDNVSGYERSCVLAKTCPSQDFTDSDKGSKGVESPAILLGMTSVLSSDLEEVFANVADVSVVESTVPPASTARSSSSHDEVLLEDSMSSTG